MQDIATLRRALAERNAAGAAILTATVALLGGLLASWQAIGGI